jgi:hypothetical protein
MNTEISELLSRLPRPDKHGFMSKIDKQVVDDVTAKILKAAPQSLVEVVGMLREPGDGDGYKAHYALHCVTIYVGKDKEQQRQMVAKTLAGCLGGDYPTGVKKYLIGELQFVGGAEVTATLNKFIHDKQLGDPALQALASILNTV